LLFINPAMVDTKLPERFNISDAIQYTDTIEIAYTAYRESIEKAKEEMNDFHLIDFLYAREPESTVFGFVATKNDVCFIVFRGTMSVQEWIDDLNAKSMAYPRIKQPFWKFKKNKIDKGFWKVYSTFSEPLLYLVKQAQTSKVVILGHSLGAAITSYAALDLVNEGYNVEVYSYASPRAGNIRFANYYNNKMQNSYRIQNSQDIVPDVPPVSFGYHHVDKQILLHQEPSINKIEQHSLKTYKSLLEKLQK
jgi:triacylglycerol lipase